jgi:beta-lactamase regulating signal transducer with metallopeptidase domain
MSGLFLTVLNMSLTASYVILFVILIRLALKKAPKFISYALWVVVAFRLIIPFSFKSIFSLMPRNTNTVPISYDIIYQQSPQINSGIEVVDSFVSGSLPAPVIGASVNPLQIYVEIGAYIWVLGIIALLIYSLISIFILKRQLNSAQFSEKNIFEAKNLKTPFVLGLVKPKIYLPARINDEERNYILLHEQTHIHRKDHIIKILAFLILSMHWFNPLAWIAFILMSTDMELSCDERVLKEMNEDIKKPYANSLLSLATGRHILNGSPLAFGEGNIKGRIKNVMNYKKPGFWVVGIAIIIVIGIGIGLMTNPINAKEPSDFSDIYEISEKWAEALKNRDGKIRYELMAPESKAEYYNSLVEINGDIEYPWIIGWSSPYVESYNIKTSGTSAVITYITKTQSEPEEYIYQEQLFFINIEGKTFVSKYNENVLNQRANQNFSIDGENLYNAADETIIEFGKAFVNLFNGAIAEQKKYPSKNTFRTKIY